MLFQITLSIFIINMVLLFPMLQHPLSMGANLLILTISLSLILGSMMSHTWLSYCLVLILLGGLLVIFIYISLLASNEVFSKKKNWMLTMLTSNMLILFFLYLNWNNETINSLHNSDFISFHKESLNWLSPFYSQEMGPMTLFLVFYLLLTLLVVVFNTKNHSMSLRSHFK